MTASFIYIILFISSLALKTGPLSRSTHLGLVYLSYRHILASNALFDFPYRPFFLFLFFLSFFLSFFFLFYYMPITLSILASCNFFRSNNFLASLAVIQAHSIYLIMTSFLYTEQILFVRLPIGFGDRPVKSFYSFRTRYRPIVGLELLILLFYSLIKLTSLHRLGICCNNQTLPVGSVIYKNNRQIQ